MSLCRRGRGRGGGRALWRLLLSSVSRFSLLFCFCMNSNKTSACVCVLLLPGYSSLQDGSADPPPFFTWQQLKLTRGKPSPGALGGPPPPRASPLVAWDRLIPKHGPTHSASATERGSRSKGSRGGGVCGTALHRCAPHVLIHIQTLQ